MRTPSLRQRVTRTGVLSFAALLLIIDVVLYLYLQQQLQTTVTEVLSARAEIAATLARGREPVELLEGLQSAGVPARISLPDGQQLQTSLDTTRAGTSPPVDPGLPQQPRISREMTLEDGTRIEVFATLAGVRTTLRDLLIGQAVVSTLALLGAGLLLHRASSVALRPLDTVIETADRIAAGDIGERLNPDDPATELGRMAARFDRMLDALERAVVEAQEAEEGSRRFLADAAHQLRTPVAALHSTVEAVLHEPDPERRDRLIGNCLRESRRLTQLLRALLLTARLDQAAPMAVTPVRLALVLADEVDRAGALAPDLQIRLQHPAELRDLTVPGDAETLREAVANLLDNARRHARAQVLVALDASGDGVRVSIRDDGPGLLADDEERAFQRFSSLDGAGGSGLGLPIARAIAAAHGGALTWEEGAFHLTLPLAPANPPAP